MFIADLKVTGTLTLGGNKAMVYEFPPIPQMNISSFRITAMANTLTPITELVEQNFFNSK